MKLQGLWSGRTGLQGQDERFKHTQNLLDLPPLVKSICNLCEKCPCRGLCSLWGNVSPAWSLCVSNFSVVEIYMCAYRRFRAFVSVYSLAVCLIVSYCHCKCFPLCRCFRSSCPLLLSPDRENKVSFLLHIQPEEWDSNTRGSGSVFILLVQECAEGKGDE